MPLSRRPTKEAERARLKQIITEWNTSRLDMFAISDPSEELDFHGVMRFFFQEKQAKVSTKCLRVSSTATVQQVIHALIERFRPDMKMLTAPSFSLYEVHANGDERRLTTSEKPLLVQLNWLKDDREGRFLLKRDFLPAQGDLQSFAGQKYVDVGGGEQRTPAKARRKLSGKKERKDSRKKGGAPASAAAKRPLSVDDTTIGLSIGSGGGRSSAAEGGGGGGELSVAGALYEELPESSFTRSLSNPEAVMRRRRQQKFEKKLESFKSKEGSGGLLRVYAESLKPEGPYKTLLLSIKDRVSWIIKEALDKFGLGRENAADYCLVMSSMSTVGAKKTWHPGMEKILDENECPLRIKQEWSSTKYTEPTFHLRKRPFVPRTPVPPRGPRKDVVHNGFSQMGTTSQYPPVSPSETRLPAVSDVPYLIEVTAEGHMTPDAQKFKLQPNVTHVGSERARVTATGAIVASQMLLPFNDVQPRHCKLANMSGFVTLTPLSPQAETFVSGELIHETTLLQNRCIIVFGNSHAFMYVDPRESGSGRGRQVNGDVRTERLVSDAASSSAGDTTESTSDSSRPPSDQPVTPKHISSPLSSAVKSTPLSNQQEFFGSRKPLRETMSPPQRFPTRLHSTPSRDSDYANTSSRDGPSLRTSWSIETSGEKPMTRQTSFSGYDSIVKKAAAPAVGLLRQYSNTENLIGELELSGGGSGSGGPPAVGQLRKRQSGQRRLSTGSDSVFLLSMDGSWDLPAFLAFSEKQEDGLISHLVTQCSGAVIPFKLGPSFVLFLCARYRVSSGYLSVVGGNQKGAMAVDFLKKALVAMSRSVQISGGQFGELAFWLANSSELFHFVTSDQTLSSSLPEEIQSQLDGIVRMAFKGLVQCMQRELQTALSAFLTETDDDGDGDGIENRPGDVNVTIRDDSGWPVWIRPSWRTLLRRQSGGINMTDFLSTLSAAMALLRCCRVNAALTIQLFSRAFHFINAWLFNKVVMEPRLELCNRRWGCRILHRLELIQTWAKRQGLELAAECHMAKIIQTCQLLQASKSRSDDVSLIASTCFKLNSIQLRTMLRLYRPAVGEPDLYAGLAEGVAAVAESTADELTKSEGGEVRLEEEYRLSSPFVIPNDGYSCDIVTGMPAGLADFIEPLNRQGLCKLTVYSTSSGSWAPWNHVGGKIQKIARTPTERPPRRIGSDMAVASQKASLARVASPPVKPAIGRAGSIHLVQQSHQANVVNVSLTKGSSGLGVSIVGGKSSAEGEWGIYVKSIVRGGTADKDGRLEPGDQLVQVDNYSLVNVTQDQAAQIMKKTGPIVRLQVIKRAALLQGIAAQEESSPVKRAEDTSEASRSDFVHRRHRRSDEPPLSSRASDTGLPSSGGGRFSVGEISPSPLSPTKPQLAKWLFEQQQQRAQQAAQRERAKMRNDPEAEARIELAMKEKEEEHKIRMERLRREHAERQLERRLAEPEEKDAENAVLDGRLKETEREWQKAFAAEYRLEIQEEERLKRHQSEEELRKRVLADSQYLERQRREQRSRSGESGARLDELKEEVDQRDDQVDARVPPRRLSMEELEQRSQDLLNQLDEQEDEELKKQEQLLVATQLEQSKRRETERQRMLDQIRREEEIVIEQETRLQRLRQQKEKRLHKMRQVEVDQEEEHKRWLAEQRRRKQDFERKRRLREEELRRLEEENSRLEVLEQRRHRTTNEVATTPTRRQTPERRHGSTPARSASSSSQHSREDLSAPEASDRSRQVVSQYRRSGTPQGAELTRAMSERNYRAAEGPSSSSFSSRDSDRGRYRRDDVRDGGDGRSPVVSESTTSSSRSDADAESLPSTGRLGDDAIHGQSPYMPSSRLPKGRAGGGRGTYAREESSPSSQTNERDSFVRKVAERKPVRERSGYYRTHQADV